MCKMNNNRNKFHVNPDFINFLENEVPLSKPILHINPNFYPKIINGVNTNCNILNTKIYVNPRFVAQNHAPTIGTVGMYEVTHNTENLNITYHDAKTEKMSLPISLVPKSRYKLIRNEALPNNNKTLNATVKQKSTIVINKYKTASIRVLKENLENANNIKSSSVNNMNISHNEIQNKSNVNRYKYVKAPNSSSIQQSNIVYNKITTQSTKTYLESTNKLKLMSIENSIRLRRKMNSNMLKQKSLKSRRPAVGKLKKNNIPCPLFKKYGKCIRKIHGNCKFIHDKKHVSICKKFLQGLCYDINCLLSHELTAKKMPTCRFYLKGLCTRDNCPYVHVKLNDKTSICIDFLKGYCEKGDQCLKRHINMCPRFTITGKCPVLKCPYPHEVLKPKNLKHDTKSEVTDKVNNNETRKHSDESCSNDADGNTNDKRYYVDDAQMEKGLPKSEVIRPSRCKLGALPSYIKL